MTNVVLVDENDNEIGLKEKFAAHKIPVPLHRAISIVIFNKDKTKTLVTKRAECKPTWPHYWSNAVCTNLYPAESYKEAADRRIFEELGFKTPLTEAFVFIYKANMDNGVWGEHELDHVFTGVYEGKVNPNPDEVEDYKWIKLTALKKDISENPDIYSPWFKIILTKLKKSS